jgi:Holliday junction resolvase
MDNSNKIGNVASARKGGRASRDKGNRAERSLVRFFQDHCFAAERVPLSGAARGRFGGDLSVPLLGIDRRVEVKARANGFRQLYEGLDDADLLIVRADRCEPLVILPLKLATEIATVAEPGKVAIRARKILGDIGEISNE